MYKKQMKAQKILCYLLLGVAALLFIATLGMATDLYEILFQCYDPQIEREYVKGATLFLEIQDFNKLAVKLAIALIVVSLLMFISSSHTRRRYYIFNYIATAVVVVCFITVAVYIIVGVLEYKAQFLTVDFEELKAFAESPRGQAKGVKYSTSTLWLDFNIVACVITIIVAILAVLNLVWKIYLEKSEQKLLTQDNQAEVA